MTCLQSSTGTRFAFGKCVSLVAEVMFTPGVFFLCETLGCDFLIAILIAIPNQHLCTQILIILLVVSRLHWCLFRVVLLMIMMSIEVVLSMDPDSKCCVRR